MNLPPNAVEVSREALQATAHIMGGQSAAALALIDATARENAGEAVAFYKVGNTILVGPLRAADPVKTVTNEMLVKAGFVEGAPSDLATGCAFVKRTVAGAMPYLNEHVVGDMDVTELSIVVLTISDDREVSFRIYSAHMNPETRTMLGALYSEGPVSIDSEEGLGIIRDAGVVLQ